MEERAFDWTALRQALENLHPGHTESWYRDYLDGLYRFITGQEEDAMPEIQGDPRLVECPNCFARPGSPCTQPNNHSRYPVRWYHLAREAAARKSTEDEKTL